MPSLAYCPTCGHKHILEALPDPTRGLRCVQCGAMVRKPRAAEVPASRFALSPAVGEEPSFSAPSLPPEPAPAPPRKPEPRPRVEEPRPETPPAPPEIDEGVPPHMGKREDLTDRVVSPERAPVEVLTLAPPPEDKPAAAPDLDEELPGLVPEERIQAEKPPAVEEEEAKE